MGINLKNKGNRTINKAILYLETLGYRVANVEKTGKFERTKDLFGLSLEQKRIMQ